MKYKENKQVSEALPPYSVYTWPFRLSITHASWNRHGQYFPDLEERIERYCDRLEKGRSLVFFYLNYDNPVSADEYKYALVGCGRLADLETTGHFPFDADELEEMRSDKTMKNFPTLNWALRVTHGGPDASVKLPYHEYLGHIASHPEDERKLEEIRVLIDEPALLPGFKYVSEQVNDDQALSLLYKLKRAFSRVQEHGIADADQQLELIDQFIEEAWEARGLYPGLGSVVSVLSDLVDGQSQKETLDGQRLVEAVRATLESEADLMEKTCAFLEGNSKPPSGFTAKPRRTLRRARAGLKDNAHLLPVLKKLSLFALTTRQVARVLFPDSDGPHAFGGETVSARDLEENPYLLAESYVPSTASQNESNEDLDREQRTDGPIDYFTIDIGMFPDEEYCEPNDEVQTFTVAGPERLRAFAIEALRRNEALGHSFAALPALVEEARTHPLFYKSALFLNPEQFLSENHLTHFKKRLHVREHDGEHYFYLQATKDAEEIVNRFVTERLALSALKFDFSWLEGFLVQEADLLAEKIDKFDAPGFKAERGRLMRGVLERPLFCITGRPGSGKTQALHTVLDKLEKAGESAIVLAPTGKAALRLNQESKKGRNWKAETIDRWVYRSGLGKYADGKPLRSMSKSEKYQNVDNIVIDEMSMVDLHQLALLFRAVEVNQPGSIRRVILVGDENQLPPIGCGRPFNDIILHLREQENFEEGRDLIRLMTNCRQQHDSTVLDAAHLFAGKNRYHTELYEHLLKGGKISDYLDVAYWGNAEELQTLVLEYFEKLLSDVPERNTLTDEEAFNRFLGLYDNGFVPGNAPSKIGLDRAQILTPYRGGPSGALGLSDYVRKRYRHDSWPDKNYKATSFAHSDKIIRISNYYCWNKEEKKRELCLSNGSIGILCNNKSGRKAFFAERQWPLDWNRLEEEDFELAYGVTVHKSQGSEFEEVLVVIPERRALLSRELVYTALTRSKAKLTILVQKTPRTNPLVVARDRSVLLMRNSSIFADPFDARRMFEPEEGVKVRSKIEYLIYQELKQDRDAGKLSFSYEEEMELPINGKTVRIKPDFTIRCNGQTFYWEHLGMLDRADYSRDWRERLQGYERKGLSGALVTTDDLGGVKHGRLKAVLADIEAGTPGGENVWHLSSHHYQL